MKTEVTLDGHTFKMNDCGRFVGLWYDNHWHGAFDKDSGFRLSHPAERHGDNNAYGGCSNQYEGFYCLLRETGLEWVDVVNACRTAYGYETLPMMLVGPINYDELKEAGNADIRWDFDHPLHITS